MISGLMFSTTNVKYLRHIRQSWRSIGGALCRRIRGPPINGTQTNSEDPDQTPQNAASDQDSPVCIKFNKILRNMIIKTNQTALI